MVVKFIPFSFVIRINFTTFVYEIPHIMKKYKVREIISMLEEDGWVMLKRKPGDHRQFKHPTKPGKVTVRGAGSEVLNQFLLNSIFKQAGWK